MCYQFTGLCIGKRGLWGLPSVVRKTSGGPKYGRHFLSTYGAMVLRQVWQITYVVVMLVGEKNYLLKGANRVSRFKMDQVAVDVEHVTELITLRDATNPKHYLLLLNLKLAFPTTYGFQEN
jgi:hypothetical protein